MHCPWHIVARSCGMCLIPRRKRRVNQMHLVEDVDDAPSSGAASSGAGPSCVSCPICKVQHGAVDKASPQVPGQPPSRVALVDGIDICCDITLGTHYHDVSPEERREMETHRILLVVVGYPLSIDCLVSLFFVMRYVPRGDGRLRALPSHRSAEEDRDKIYGNAEFLGGIFCCLYFPIAGSSNFP